jgi:hypothetical protein
MPPHTVIGGPDRGFDHQFSGYFAENGVWHVLTEASFGRTLTRGIILNFA